MVYRVHAVSGPIKRLLGADRARILTISHAADGTERLSDFIKSADTGRKGHSEGRTLYYCKGLCKGLRELLGDGLGFSYRGVDPRYLFQEENLSRDSYIREFGELPPLNGEITGDRKRMTGLRRKLGMLKKRN